MKRFHTLTALQLKALRYQTQKLFAEHSTFLTVCTRLAEAIVEDRETSTALAAANKTMAESAPHFADAFSVFVLKAMSASESKPRNLPGSLRRAIAAGDRAVYVRRALDDATSATPSKAIEEMLDPQQLLSTPGGIRARRERVYELINDVYDYPDDEEASRLKDQAYERIKDGEAMGGTYAGRQLDQAEEQIAKALKLLRAKKKTSTKPQNTDK